MGLIASLLLPPSVTLVSECDCGFLPVSRKRYETSGKVPPILDSIAHFYMMFESIKILLIIICTEYLITNSLITNCTIPTPLSLPITHYRNPLRMPACFFCSASLPLSKLHQVTAREPLRGQWIAALSKDDSERATQEIRLRTATGVQYICASHFSSDSYTETPTTRVLKRDAVPMSLVSTTTLYLQKEYFYLK